MHPVEIVCGVAAVVMGIAYLWAAIRTSKEAKPRLRRFYLLYATGMLLFGLGITLEEALPHQPTLSLVKHLSVVIGCILLIVSLYERERMLKQSRR